MLLQRTLNMVGNNQPHPRVLENPARPKARVSSRDFRHPHWLCQMLTLTRDPGVLTLQAPWTPWQSEKAHGLPLTMMLSHA